MIIAISVSEGDERIIFDFYLPVPVGNNNAGITWRDAIIQSKMYDIETIGESDYVKTRELYAFSSIDLTNTQRLNELEIYHIELLTNMLNKIQTELKFTGYKIE